MLLGVGNVLNLETGPLEDGLKISVYYKRRLCKILGLVKFYLRLFLAWHQEYMKKRHEVVSRAKLFVSRKDFLR